MNDQTVSCSICSERFPSSDDYDTHMAMAHIWGPFVHELPLGEAENSKILFRLHLEKKFEEMKEKILHQVSINPLTKVIGVTSGDNQTIVSHDSDTVEEEDEAVDSYETHRNVQIFNTNDHDITVMTIHQVGVNLCSECGEELLAGVDSEMHSKFGHKDIDLENFALTEHICPDCGYKNASGNDLEVHKRTHKKYACNKCDYRSANESDVKSHQKIHKKTTITRKYCEKCEYSSINASDLKRHQSVHVPNRSKNFSCDDCNISYNLSSSLKRHNKAKHAGAEKFSCSNCEYGTFNKPDLKRHRMTTHGEGVELSCSSCDFKTHHSSSLKRHQAAKHE